MAARNSPFTIINTGNKDLQRIQDNVRQALARLQSTITALIPTSSDDEEVVGPVRISTALASGSRVTGAAPAATGQYRCLIKGASSILGSDNAPGAAPSTSNGMRVYGNKAYSAAGTSGETGRWEIYVGTNKVIQWEFYSGSGRTGRVDPSYFFVGTTSTIGMKWGYDPTTGVAWIDGMHQSTGTTSRNAGVGFGATGGTGDVGNFYFDIVVVSDVT
jgi:hypothetical protein